MGTLIQDLAEGFTVEKSFKLTLKGHVDFTRWTWVRVESIA
jgi:hypothetical protein